MVVAGVSSGFAAEYEDALGADGSGGSISSDDESPTQSDYYGGVSNTGDIESEDNNDEDPLDEEYYGSGEDGSSGGSFNVRLDRHATANPLLLGFFALIVSLGLFSIRHWTLK